MAAIMTASGSPLRHALYLDAIVWEGGSLASAESLERLARDAAEVAGMRILDLRTFDIDQDLSKLHSEIFEDEGGVSLHALLSTSHLSIHSWPARAFFMFDLVSCRRFDQAKVEALVRARLNVKQVVHRGTTDAVWPMDRSSPGAGVSYHSQR